MKFSILIPVYNVEEYLEECLESVLSQTCKDFEVIAINDGSTDNSGIILDNYALKYDFIHVYHNRNKGLLLTRRFAISKACGEYVVNLDSDDTLEKNALEIIGKTIEQYKCECVIYGLNRFAGIKQLTPYTSSSSDVLLYKDKRLLCKEVLSTAKYNSLCRKAVKREVLGKMSFDNYSDVSHGEDALQSIEIYKNASSFVIIPQNLYNYRMNQRSMIHTKKLEDFNIKFPVNMAILEFLHNENIFNHEDFIEYRTNRADNLVTQILEIMGLSNDKNEKNILMDEIRQSDYFRGFLGKGKIDYRHLGMKCLIFFPFKWKKYRIIYFIYKIYEIIFNEK